jgi:hypothetical protein
LADKDFRVKNKLHVNGLNNASGVILATNNALDSHTNLPTQYGGTGTTTSPNSGQILYSSSGTTYAPTTLNTLDVKGATYSADAPSSPVVGQIWVESDTSSDSFDPNIMRRKTFTATAAQTVFTTDLEFIQGYEQVFFNGMLLIRNSDYTTASNTNVTLAAGAAAGDILEVVSITNLNSINTYTQSEVDALLAANIPLSPVSIYTNTTLLPKKRYFVTSASALTLTLPASPTINDEIHIIDASGNSSTYNITIARNGNNINKNAGNFIIDQSNAWISLLYTGTTVGWKVA